MIIPDRVLTEMAEIAPYLDDCDDWMVLKKLLLRSIPSEQRRLFSTRDPVTKKQSLNDFEMNIIEEYYKLTGVRLELKL